MKLTREIRDLKEYKKDNDLTLKELSKKMGIADAQLSSWMTGRIKPNNESLQNISLFLKNAYSVKNINTLKYQGITYVDSRTVAKWMSKEHYHLTRDIKNHIEKLKELSTTVAPAKSGECQNVDIINIYDPNLYFVKDETINPANKMKITFYHVSFKGCELLAHKMNGIRGIKFTALYIDEFHKLADGKNQNSSDAGKIVSNIFNQSFNTPNQEPQQTELLQDESVKELTPLQQDMNYLQQRINRLKDIKDLDKLHDELDTITKLSKFMQTEHLTE